MSNNLENVIPKKRGRKPKIVTDNNDKTNVNKTNDKIENIIINTMDDVFLSNNTNAENNENDNENDNDICKPIVKKRGRKPKGGKIIQNMVLLNNTKETKPNVILHLKCSLKDLNTQNLFGSQVDAYNTNGLVYDIIENENENIIINSNHNHVIDTENEFEYDSDIDYGKKEHDIRDIWKKLKVLEHYLHINNVNNKKSACFWDTCEFDNPPIYIPKHFMNNTYHVYGCFCSPECAVAHLMNEPIDSSTKFERYYLLNSIYGKIYDYKKNIKPAPNPYYMLEKYYGNLNIQEFRALLKNERLFLVVDKPLTKIMPELHEDNDDFIINNKIIPSNTYHVKKRLNKKQTKTNILSERFGLTN